MHKCVQTVDSVSTYFHMNDQKNQIPLGGEGGLG